MLPLLDGNLFQTGPLNASWWLADARVGLDSRSCNGLSFAFIWEGRLSTSAAYLSWALAVPIPLSLSGPPWPVLQSQQQPQVEEAKTWLFVATAKQTAILPFQVPLRW